jgi:glucan phosphoethanolaminetransferase (alkaline phosphatase superfamily)
MDTDRNDSFAALGSFILGVFAVAASLVLAAFLLIVCCLKVFWPWLSLGILAVMASLFYYGCHLIKSVTIQMR